MAALVTGAAVVAAAMVDGARSSAMQRMEHQHAETYYPQPRGSGSRASHDAPLARGSPPRHQGGHQHEKHTGPEQQAGKREVAVGLGSGDRQRLASHRAGIRRDDDGANLPAGADHLCHRPTMRTVTVTVFGVSGAVRTVGPPGSMIHPHEPAAGTARDRRCALGHTFVLSTLPATTSPVCSVDARDVGHERVGVGRVASGSLVEDEPPTAVCTACPGGAIVKPLPTVRPEVVRQGVVVQHVRLSLGLVLTAADETRR